MAYDAMGNYTGPDDETAAAPAAAPSREQGFSFSEFFMERAVDVGAFLHIPGAAEAQIFNQIKHSENPGSMMMGVLANQEGFKEGQPGRAQLDAIRGDRNFMASLNGAIRSDRSILENVMTGAGGEGGASPAEIVESLSNPRNRGLMTRVLNRIGEDANDDIDGQDLKTVMDQAQRGDYAALNTTLQGMGINDPMVAMATDPIGAIGDFLRNPQEGLANWLNDPSSPLANLSGDTKNLIGRLVEMLSGFLKGFAPGGGFLDEFREFGSHYGAVLTAEGHQRGYDGSNPTRADGNNIVVAQEMRPARGGAFASAAGGEAPRSAPQELIDRVRVEHPELQQQTMGGASFRLS